MSSKPSQFRGANASTPSKKDHFTKSHSPKKSKGLSSSSVAHSSVSHLSWDANTNDSNGNVTFNIEIPNGGWDNESSSGHSSPNLVIEDAVTPSSYKKSRKRLRSEVSVEGNSILDGMEEEIERQLEAKAERNNLSVLNVKNILRQVITHPHVLAMVKRTARDGNCTISGDIDDFMYEPTLTRAKAKELLEKVKDVDWPVTPCKKPVVSEFEALAIQELAEDSDDEEYHPGDETSDNDISERDNSELDTPVEQSPASSCIDADERMTSTPYTPDSTADRSLTNWTDDGIFKIPLTPAEHAKDAPTHEEVIAGRTRSKLSLSDTPLEEIEKSFVPPDVPPGYYESNLNETAGDNEDWYEFLKEFMEPLPSDQQATEVNDDDEADPEYNVLAEEEVVDKEELRMDRAVKVSRREVNALLAELFEYTENLSSEEDDAKNATISDILYSSCHRSMDCTVTSSGTGNQGASSLMADSRGKTSRECNTDVEDGNNNVNKGMSDETESANSTFILSLPQRLLLDQQMRQHVQQLTQTYLLTYDHPAYKKYAPETLNSLEEIEKKAQDSHPLSPFRVANLPAAFEVIYEWKRIMASEKGDGIRAFMARQYELWHLSISRRMLRFPGALPPELMELMGKSVAFVTPQLLPYGAFRCKAAKPIIYLPPEVMLIALGLEEFANFVETNLENAKKLTYRTTLQYLSHYLVPTKDAEQLKGFIRKERKKADSPIKFYYDHKRAPATVHYVYPGTLMPPIRQPSYLLPPNWRNFLYPAN